MPLTRNMPIIDANIILRYLLNDNELLVSAAREILDHDKLEAPNEVICEVVYVLQKNYRVPHDEIARQMRRFCERGNIILSNQLVLFQVLDFFAATNLDFVDCILAGYAVAGIKIHTLDQKLEHFIQNLIRTIPNA